MTHPTKGALASMNNSIPAAQPANTYTSNSKAFAEKVKDLQNAVEAANLARLKEAVMGNEYTALEAAVTNILAGLFDGMPPEQRRSLTMEVIHACHKYDKRDWALAVAKYAYDNWERTLNPALDDKKVEPASDLNPTPPKVVQGGIAAHMDDLARAEAIANGTGWKDDKGKFPWSRMPMEFLDWLSEIYAHGAAKYEWDNWMTLDADRMADATFRHIKHHIEDRQAGILLPTDKDSKYSALAHVACGALMTLWLCHQEVEKSLDEEFGPVEPEPEPEPDLIRCVCVDGPMAGHAFLQNPNAFRKEARFPGQSRIGDSPNIYVYEHVAGLDGKVTRFHYKHSLGVTHSW